jgi:hypothetical protein
MDDLTPLGRRVYCGIVVCRLRVDGPHTALKGGALFARSGFRAILHPLQPAQEQANLLRQFFHGDIARGLTQ